MANRKDRLFSIEVPVWAAVAAVLLFSVSWPVLITRSAEVSSQSRATSVGLLGASNQSGGVCEAALGGKLLAASGFPGVGYLCLGAAALATVVIARFMRRPGP